MIKAKDPLVPVLVRIEADLYEGLQTVKARDGIPVSVQVRRGIQMWLREKQVLSAGLTELDWFAAGMKPAADPAPPAQRPRWRRSEQYKAAKRARTKGRGR